MNTEIETIHAREVFNSKGVPTLEVEVTLSGGGRACAAAPGGTSRGKHEPVDLLDGDPSYFGGLGVGNAVRIVNETVAAALAGKDARDQENIDGAMLALDGTADKSILGGNSMIAVSVACAKAAACGLGIPLFEHLGGGREIPVPFVYVMFSGPAYVGTGDTCDFQEYALIPLKAPTYREGYLATLGIYRKLASLLSGKSGYVKAGYSKISGIPVARFGSNSEPFEVLTGLIDAEGYAPGEDFGIHVDIAASQLYREGTYHLKADGLTLSRDGMIDRLDSLCRRFPIVSLEDPLHEDDWEGWKLLTDRLKGRVQVSGDDLFVTHPDRLKKGIEAGAANGVIIKPNQIGTVSETLRTIRIAKEAGYATMISPRSGELWDPLLTHLCVGQNLGQGKLVGAYSSGEANLNELIRIGDRLGTSVVYRNGSIFPGRGKVA